MQTTPTDPAGKAPDHTAVEVIAAEAIADKAPDSLLARPAQRAKAVTRTSLTSLQALRGIAMLLVVWHHVMYFMLYRLLERPLDGALVRRFPVIEEFAFGQDIFFVLSGFLLMLIAKPYLDRRRTLGNFMLHRIVRIWPLYVVTTCVVLARELTPTLFNRAPLPVDFDLRRLSGLFFFPTFNTQHDVKPIYNPGWALSYEMLFYLAFALAVRLSATRKELMLALTGVMLSLLVLGYNLPQTHAICVFLANPIVVEFLIGSGICMLLQSGHRIPLQAAWWFALAFVWVMLSIDINIEQGPRLLARGVPAAMLLIAMLKIEGQADFPRWLVAVGNASFSIFLSHDIVLPRMCDAALGLLDGRLPDSLLGEMSAIVAFVPTVLVGIVIFHLVEKWLILKTKEWVDLKGQGTA